MHSVDGPWCSLKKKAVSYLQTAPDCYTEYDALPPEPVQTKVCSHCGRELPVSNFGRHSRTKDGYQPCCKECQSEMNKGHKKRQPFEHNEAPVKPEEPEKIPDGMKRCSHCGKILPVSEFNKHKGTKDGLQYACKECQVEMTTKAKQRRTEEKKEIIREVRKEAVKAKILSGEPEVVNDLFEAPIPPVPTLYSATDDQLVDELKRRGYTGNIIRKTSFIL